MPELIAKGPLDGQAALSAGGVTLTPGAEGPLWSLALFPNGAEGAARALQPLGLTFPAPGEWLANGDSRILWTGRDQALLSGAVPEGLEGHAAVTDQSGGWASIVLRGPGVVDALARLVAVDLRLAVFPVGRVARTGLNHISAIVLRTGEDAFEVLVFRSMVRSAWHELAEVLAHLQARAG